MELTLLIPAYNEEERIRNTLDAYLHALETRDAEILIVVNGSRDQTEALVRDEYLRRLEAIRLVVIPEKVGKGGAIMRGLQEARGEKIAFTDADGSTPPSSLLRLVDALEAPGICIGSRWLDHSVIGVPQPLPRQLASRIFNLWVRLLFRLRVKDTQCGAKVMTREVMEAVLPLLGCTQWAFDVELLFHIRKCGYPIQELPVEWNNAEGSKLKLLPSSLQMMLALVRLRVRHSPFRFVVDLWDNSLGKKLYQQRLERLEAVYRTSSTEESCV